MATEQGERTGQRSKKLEDRTITEESLIIVRACTHASDGAPSARNRRRADRRPCSLGIRLLEPDGRYGLNWLLDLSPVGAAALVYAPLPGDIVQGEIVANDVERAFPFAARIVWSVPGRGSTRVGMEFIDLSPDLLRWLERYAG